MIQHWLPPLSNSGGVELRTDLDYSLLGQVRQHCGRDNARWVLEVLLCGNGKARVTYTTRSGGKEVQRVGTAPLLQMWGKDLSPVRASSQRQTSETRGRVFHLAMGIIES